jgi:GLPGLI family protein
MKSFKNITLSLAICLGLTPAFAQKGKAFEGKIVYEINFPGMELDAASAAMLPKEMTMYIKNGKVRNEMSMGMGMTTSTISDSKTKSAITLMDIMGSKYAIKTTEAELKKDQPKEDPTVKITEETKKIAGYDCKKAIVTMGDKEKSTINIYFTPEIGSKDMNWSKPEFKGIDGFPMEFEMKQNGMNMHMIAKSVSTETITESKFVVPADYKETTQEELQKMFGGGQ